MLRPGGVVILAESEHRALTESKQPIVSGARGGAPGWHALWEQYRKCLTQRGIDVTVPTKLRIMLAATGAFEDIVAQEALIPIGFWPKGKHQCVRHYKCLPPQYLTFISKILPCSPLANLHGWNMICSFRLYVLYSFHTACPIFEPMSSSKMRKKIYINH